jgi:hypothetical protein
MAVIVTHLFLAHELRGRDSNPYSRIQNPLSYHLNDPGPVGVTPHATERMRTAQVQTRVQGPVHRRRVP